MSRYTPYLQWVEGQHERMCRLVERWVGISSASHDLEGLARMARELSGAMSVLDKVEEIVLPEEPWVDVAGRLRSRPLGKALSMAKRPEAPVQVFLAIHMDTVYGPEHPFTGTFRGEGNRFYGPGVADAKGGLAVMLVALEALERSEWAGNVGWRVVINPDEELGSPSSSAIMVERARGCALALLFEPAMADGSLAGERKGSGNFTFVVRGRSAHAGRNVTEGRNAIHALAGLVVALRELPAYAPGTTVNVGRIEGGTAVNVVPDLAIARLNVRFERPEDEHPISQRLQQIAAYFQHDGIRVELHGGITAPAKPLDDRTLRLLQRVADCGREIGVNICWKPVGGVCDGNRLAAAGLPVVDSLGVVGGEIHSDREYMLMDSLTQRAKLSALLLMKLAAGEIPAAF